MKKLIVAIVCSFTMFTSTNVEAQKTKPRYAQSGLGNTYSSQKLTYQAITDATSATVDTMYITPNSLSHTVALTVTDSVAIAIKGGSSYDGDEVTFEITATNGSRNILFTDYVSKGVTSSYIFGTGTFRMTVAANKLATITFRRIGTSWLETSRNVGQ